MDVSEIRCGGCLSSDRRLLARPALQATYDMLMRDFAFENTALQAHMCWECAARLARVLQTQRSMRRAQTILLAASKHKEHLLTSISHLEISATKTFSFTLRDSISDLSCKKEVEIKTEIEYQQQPVEEHVARGVADSAYDERICTEIFFDSEDDSVSTLQKDVKVEYFESEQAPDHFETAEKSSTRPRRAKRKASDAAGTKRKRAEQVKIGARKEWECTDCERCFGTRGKLSYHRRTAHAEPVLCNECGRVFTFKPTLEKHMLTHFGGIPQHPCAICGKSFAGRAGVRSHMTHMHPSGAQEHYRCEPCDLTFKTKYKYKSHLKWSRRHGGIGTERHECDKCHRRYKTKQRLLEHYSYQHLGRPAHKCHICGKEISSLLGLQKHVRCVHEARERPRTHVCETCGDAFMQPSMLRQHRYIHTGERPHACADCGATFRQKGSLYTHNKLVHLKLQRGASLRHRET